MKIEFWRLKVGPNQEKLEPHYKKYFIIFLIISGDSSIRASRNLSTFSFNVKLEASDEDNTSNTIGLSLLIRDFLLKWIEGSAFLKIKKIDVH